ncbi:hypothetical protein [Synechococcus sp. CBW1004]|uniref:hypothetical protein n=1 Tax=Synechococcus sp. CBW1004 TaxID=1353136 RepID=UPI0018CE67BC|nr:hypothetical protein [Synechococcus sp. CBW1004]
MASSDITMGLPEACLLELRWIGDLQQQMTELGAGNLGINPGILPLAEDQPMRNAFKALPDGFGEELTGSKPDAKSGRTAVLAGKRQECIELVDGLGDGVFIGEAPLPVKNANAAGPGRSQSRPCMPHPSRGDRKAKPTVLAWRLRHAYKGQTFLNTLANISATELVTREHETAAGLSKVHSEQSADSSS